uniref:Cruciform cutting endonuclease 1, mitochondrial n=1 Tax=Talaromyces marneffei PM1 TaxID=1077442 RepID=A0A093VEZ8_TALMA
MRLTLPLLSKPKSAATLLKPKPDALESYLSALKATQLKSLARATGIPNSGRKDELRRRINDEVLRSVFLSDAGHHDPSQEKMKRGRGGGGGGGGGGEAKELSVLSIDMGIQNLAFAHLIVRSPEHLVETRDGLKKGLITLNAWHRIGVQELAAASPATHDAETEVKLQSLLPSSAFRTFTTTKQQSLTEINETEEHPSNTETANKNFEPDTLSHNAFVLLSSLLQAYKPTHILIERQRFRSAGQSAVLEWSLRVGVFEGMLHAVLCTMRELSRFNKRRGDMDGVVDALQVYPISPGRIMQFWDEGKSQEEEGNEDDGEGSKKGKNRVKRFKMDVVGDILCASTISKPGKESLLCWDVAVNTDKDKPSGPGVADVVDAYLRRWNPQLSVSETKTSKKSKTSNNDNKQAYKIDKMDDLADCLLQGLTWLEWQARRAKIARGQIP